jgi:hypothetical protein
VLAIFSCKKLGCLQTTSHVSLQHDLHERAAAEYRAVLGRLARDYEADPDKRRDLLPERPSNAESTRR